MCGLKQSFQTVQRFKQRNEGTNLYFLADLSEGLRSVVCQREISSQPLENTPALKHSTCTCTTVMTQLRLIQSLTGFVIRRVDSLSCSPPHHAADGTRNGLSWAHERLRRTPTRLTRPNAARAVYSARMTLPDL